MTRQGTCETMGAELDRIGLSERTELLDRWQDLLGSPAPKSLSLALLRRVVAYEIQCRALGGLHGKTRTKLARIAAATDIAGTGKEPAASPAAARTVRLQPGARLIRDWNGKTWVVDVTDAGFVMQGRTYRSLTAIVKHITGAHWSGPRFFGLKTRHRSGHRRNAAEKAA